MQTETGVHLQQQQQADSLARASLGVALAGQRRLGVVVSS
jgi:hypothetical protein